MQPFELDNFDAISLFLLFTAATEFWHKLRESDFPRSAEKSLYVSSSV